MAIPGVTPEHIDNDVVGRTLACPASAPSVTTWTPSSAHAASTASSVTSPSLMMDADHVEATDRQGRLELTRPRHEAPTPLDRVPDRCHVNAAEAPGHTGFLVRQLAGGHILPGRPQDAHPCGRSPCGST